MGDSDERSVGGVDSEVKIATDVGVGASYNFEVIFGSELADVGVRGGGSDDDLTRESLVCDGFDARFEIRALLVGEDNESMNRCSRIRHLGLLGLSTGVEFVLEKAGVDCDKDEAGDEEGVDSAVDKGRGDKD